MRNHYPAIDILPSISRLMSSIVAPEHQRAAGKIRQMMSVYQENTDLLSIGAYKSGSNPELDEAIRHMDAINGLLQQSVGKKEAFQDTVTQMEEIVES
jgi:flagellum-specific ATP synthase